MCFGSLCPTTFQREGAWFDLDQDRFAKNSSGMTTDLFRPLLEREGGTQRGFGSWRKTSPDQWYLMNCGRGASRTIDCTAEAIWGRERHCCWGHHSSVGCPAFDFISWGAMLEGLRSVDGDSLAFSLVLQFYGPLRHICGRRRAG